MTEVPYEVLDKVQQHVERTYLKEGSNIHTVGKGLILKDGKETGEIGIVVKVGQKMTAQQLKARGVVPVPPAIAVDGYKVCVDVIQQEQPKITRLMLDEAFHIRGSMHPQGAAWQRCHPVPVHGGVQIAPEGAQWVGTLSCMLLAPNREGKLVPMGLTNNHVAIKSNAKVGDRMLQPGPGADHLGTLYQWAPIQYQSRDNYIDAALFDCVRTDGLYAPNTCTIHPTQYQLGKINPNPVSFKIGDRVVKSGRTTGIVRGRCTGIDQTSYVGYDGGSAKFVKQDEFRGDNGDLSAPGDSGSLILTESDLRPGALLFAGGGGSTLGNPIRYVLDWCKGQFYQVPA